jgi:menaquinol-cytochrome c reductase iron-sulfur subunit
VAEDPGNGTLEHDGDGHYQGPRAHDPGPTHDHSDDPDYVTRTKFLSGVALATGAVMGAAIIVPVVGFAIVDPLKGEDFRWIDAGPAKDLIKNPPPYAAPDGGGDPVVGGVASIAISGPNPEGDRRVFIALTRKVGKVDVKALEVAEDDLELLAIWNRCAHLGCPVEEGSGTYACPCHGGAYDDRGLVSGGPPPRPLDRFDIKITDGTKDVPLPEAFKALAGGTGDKLRVLVGKPYSIDKNEKPYKLRLPGEPVDGVLSNLYPF